VQRGPATSRAARRKTLDRILSKAGVGSRTEAALWIRQGRVRVNGGVRRDPDEWVDPARDRVTFDGSPVRPAAPVVLAFHKPRGVLTTRRDPAGRPTIYDLLPPGERRLIAVGRLDLDTSGLLLLTSDNDLAERLTNPRFKVPKTYEVEADEALGDEQIERLRRGVALKDGPTRPAEVRRLGTDGERGRIEVTITEGRNRQIRRMLEAVGARVARLHRTVVGPIRLAGLAEGTTRPLSSEERRRLRPAGTAVSRRAR
jgi:23S rRNA pseudouridine2605 synthase